MNLKIEKKIRLNKKRKIEFELKFEYKKHLFNAS